jgi:hypothetical protein
MARGLKQILERLKQIEEGENRPLTLQDIGDVSTFIDLYQAGWIGTYPGHRGYYVTKRGLEVLEGKWPPQTPPPPRRRSRA